MIQEYLFASGSYKKDICNLQLPDGAKTEIQNFKTCESWVYLVEIPGNSMYIAKTLSFFHEDFKGKFSPFIILTNDCSAYFNRKLYPLINDFELKLRKLLNLASSVSKTPGEFKENIKELDSKSLEGIFRFLFYDQKFMDDVRNCVKNKDSHFDKIKLNSIPENTLWDRTFGKDKAPTLREHHSEIKDFRNDVMHAHDTSFEKYKEIKKLFSSLNQELTAVISYTEKEAREDSKNGEFFENFNREMSRALAEAREALENVDSGSMVDRISASLLDQGNNAAVTAMKAIANVQPGQISSEMAEALEKMTEALGNLNVGNLGQNNLGIYIPLQEFGNYLTESNSELEQKGDLNGSESGEINISQKAETSNDEETNGDSHDDEKIHDGTS